MEKETNIEPKVDDFEKEQTEGFLKEYKEIALKYKRDFAPSISVVILKDKDDSYPPAIVTK